MTRRAPSLSERNEAELERCDRHLAELMREVRVAQTGVPVLFGFLLTVPFSSPAAAVAAAGAMWSWYLQPLRRRRHLYRRDALRAARSTRPDVRPVGP